MGLPGSSGGSLSAASTHRKLFRLAHASNCVPSTVKCSSESSPAARAWAWTASKNAAATSPDSSRSRFLVNVVRSSARDRTILAVKERGRRRWKKTSGYHGQAINLRYQRRIVSGVTMPATCIQTRRPSFWPRTASRRRWASVRRSGRGPRCSRRTRFSSRRYAIRSSWWRFTQPANVRTRNCSAGGMA